MTFRTDTMFVVLESLRCITSNESSGDEIFIEVRWRRAGDRLTVISIPIGTFSAPQKRSLRFILPLKRHQVITVRLWEDDGSSVVLSTSKDEHIGSFTVRANDLTNWSDPDPMLRPHSFDADARYEMKFRFVGAKDMIRVLEGSASTSQVVGFENKEITLLSGVFDKYTVLSLDGQVVLGGT